MRRRDFLRASSRSAVAGAVLATWSRRVRGQDRERQPNIIFIMADDLGYANLGCYGQKLIQTPNIDRMAAQGMRFTQCYSGSTVCAPSRSCLMTGQHSGHTTVRGNGSAIGAGRVPLNAADVTVGEVLRAAGYRTGIVGKWGLGEPDTPSVPNQQGFDYWFGYLNQRRAHDYYPDYLWRNEEKVVLAGNAGETKTEYSHDLMTREALAFIRRNRQQPFFLYLAYTIPHQKLQVPSTEPYSGRAWTEKQKTMAAMVTRLDTDVGRVLTLLDELGLDDETIVFCTSDNGGVYRGKFRGDEWEMFASNAPFSSGKGSLLEGGLRVPMIVRWPGQVKAGVVSEQVWAFWDFLPTAAELAGVGAPAGVDGLSVVPTILGRGVQEQHEYLYWEFRTRSFTQAMRLGDWKAIRFGSREPVHLYDLRTDIRETRDVAAQHPDVVARVEALMAAARTESEHWPSMEYRKGARGNVK